MQRRHGVPANPAGVSGEVLINVAKRRESMADVVDQVALQAFVVYLGAPLSLSSIRVGLADLKMSRLLALSVLAVCVSLVAAEVYFEEKFDDGEHRRDPLSNILRRRLGVVAGADSPAPQLAWPLRDIILSLERRGPSGAQRPPQRPNQLPLLG